MEGGRGAGVCSEEDVRTPCPVLLDLAVPVLPRGPVDHLLGDGVELLAEPHGFVHRQLSACKTQR